MKTIIIFSHNHNDPAAFRFAQNFIKNALDKSIPLKVGAEFSDDLNIQNLYSLLNDNSIFITDLKKMKSMLRTGHLDLSKLSDTHRKVISDNILEIMQELSEGIRNEDIACLPSTKLLVETIHYIIEQNIPYQGLDYEQAVKNRLSVEFNSGGDHISKMHQHENDRIRNMIKNIKSQLSTLDSNGIFFAFNIGAVHAHRLAAHLKQSGDEAINIISIRCKADHKHLSDLTKYEMTMMDSLIESCRQAVDTQDIVSLYSEVPIHDVTLRLGNNGFTCPELTELFQATLDRHSRALQTAKQQNELLMGYQAESGSSSSTKEKQKTSNTRKKP